MVVGALTIFLVPAITDRSGTEDFYSASSQILPILILAIAIEGRWSRCWRVRDNLDFLYAVLTMAILVFGESSALYVIETSRATLSTFGSVVAGLATGLTWVVGLGLTEPPDKAERDKKRSTNGE